MFQKLQTQEALPIIEVVFRLGLAAALGILACLIYKAWTRRSNYSQSFQIAIVVIAVVVSGIITSIGSNIALSLGLVGSLSVLRFRNAVKDHLDMMFLFWGITIGISTGAGLPLIALSVSAVLILVLVGFWALPTVRKKTGAYMIRLHCPDSMSVKAAAQELRRTFPGARLRASISAPRSEATETHYWLGGHVAEDSVTGMLAQFRGDPALHSIGVQVYQSDDFQRI